MRGYSQKKGFFRAWKVILIIALLLAGGGYLAARGWYTRNLSAISSPPGQTVYFTVENGSSVHEIGRNLKQANLIRSTPAFETYVRLRKLVNRLQAGTYTLNKSMSTPQIVSKMVAGDVSKDLLTILPGKTLKQIKQAFKQSGYSDAELEQAFDPNTYSGHPVLEYLPAGASLEGMLYPDSFQKEASTSAKTIVGQSLDEMQKYLTPDILRGFSAHGLSVYEGITLASIVYAESDDPISEPTVAQVFLTRLKKDMALESDVTAFYAAAQVGAGKTLGVDSPYNTRLHPGLPPGPIGNFTAEALAAVANPSKSDYLFFVAGDDGTIHFSHTVAEHERAVKKYCTKECS